LADNDVVRITDLALGVASNAATGGGQRMEDMSLEDVERVLITKALARFQGNVSLAAQALGLSRSALYRRLQRHGL
jgi:transcriptional regulator of acetoin/glycerol metabolism